MYKQYIAELIPMVRHYFNIQKVTILIFVLHVTDFIKHNNPIACFN